MAIRPRLRVAFLALLALAVAAPGAVAAEPRLEVPAARLRASVFCPESVARAARTPVLLVTGTGLDGSEVWPTTLQVALTRAGIPSCYVDFPEHTTADLQVSVQYLVHAIRAVRRSARRDIAIYGISQGALLARFALTSWPSLRREVSDAVALAGTHHGTTTFSALRLLCGVRCRFPAAAWQQAAGSNLLRAVNRPGRDETPGPTAWTTVRSLSDEIVQPAAGRRPTSALAGASNLVIQRICPGRATSHIGTGVDSVSYAALRDAIAHRGPARASRIPASVCDRPYAPGLARGRTAADVLSAYAVSGPRTVAGADGGTLLSAEPPVRAWVRRR